MCVATIKEIAKKADCSIGTVSRVLNFDSSLRVSDAKRELILKIAEEMQYNVKRNKRRKSSTKIGIVSMYTTHEELEDPFYLSIRLGAEKRINTAKIDFFVIHDSQEGYDFAKLNGVDGIIAIGHFSKEEITSLHAITPHIVFVNSNPDSSLYDSLLFDGESAVKQVSQHLESLGHKEVGFIGVQPIHPKKAIDFDEHRDTLVEKYFKAYNMFHAKHMYQGGKTYKDGYETMKTIIDSDILPTAFFIGNDSMAIGALTALYQSGIRVPEHLSIVGYNDITNAEYSQPPLTTVKVHTELMGEKAFELVYDRIKGRDIPLKLISPTQLIIRGTTSTANGKSN